MKIQGGCLCGGMRYEIDGPLTEVGNCHCSMCRRFHGAAFSTYAKVNAEHFRWFSRAPISWQSTKRPQVSAGRSAKSAVQALVFPRAENSAKSLWDP